MTFDAEWARCSPWIEAALDYGARAHDLADVEAMIRCGEAQFWPGRNCAAVTMIDAYPKLKALGVWLAGGDLVELREEIEPKMAAYARRHGCGLITITGRSGWARALGYRPLHRTCAKEL